MRLFTVLLLVGATTLVACGKKSYNAKSAPLTAKYDKIWTALRKIVGEEYEIDEAETDKGDGVLVTKWKHDPSPEYLRTFRRRVEAKLIVHPDDLEKARKDQRFQLQVNVIKEVNDNIDAPRDVENAEWFDPTNDDPAERIILARVKMDTQDPDGPPILPQPRELEASSDGEWVETPVSNVTQPEAWDSVLQVARSFGYRDKLLQPQVGRYETDWMPSDTHEPEKAQQRNRIIAVVVPRTDGGKTRHLVRIRVEQQSRERLEGEWVDVRRDDVFEQVLGLKVQDQMRLIEQDKPAEDDGDEPTAAR